MTIDYHCNSCGRNTTNEKMESFVCKCGGTFRLGIVIGLDRTFHPEWDNEMRTYVSSYRQQERLAKKEGCVITPIEMTKKLKKIRANKEDYNRMELAQRGIRVKHGEKWDDQKGDVVSTTGRKRLYFY